MIYLYVTLLIIGAALATAFPVVYHLRNNWRAHRMGRHLMAFMVTLAVVIDLTVLGVFWPNPSLIPVAVVVFAALDVLLAERLWLLIHDDRSTDSPRRRAEDR